MSKSSVFLFILLSFIGGVFVRSFFEINQNYFFLLVLFSLIMLFIFYKNKFAALAAFFVLVFVLGEWITDREIEKTKNLIYSGKTFLLQHLGKILLQNFREKKFQYCFKLPNIQNINMATCCKFHV